jgi:hypothetical protein
VVPIGRRKTTVLSNGSIGIAMMCHCETKRPSVEGGAWRALSETGSLSETPSFETKRPHPGHGSQITTVIKNNALWTSGAGGASYENR